MSIVNTQAISLPTYRAEDHTRDGLNVTLLAVLTVDKNGFGGGQSYAVYIGAAHLPMPGKNMDLYHIARDDAAAWIARSGAKQTYRKALQYFPGLTESEYRV